jgi:hypothetical protein
MTITVRGKRPVGRAGDWTAKWDGVSYACVHHRCFTGTHYLDRFDNPSPAVTFQRYVATIQATMTVLITRSGLHENGHARREKYLSLARIDNLDIGRVGPQSIEFDIVEKLIDFVYSD